MLHDTTMHRKPNEKLDTYIHDSKVEAYKCNHRN